MIKRQWILDQVLLQLQGSVHVVLLCILALIRTFSISVAMSLYVIYCGLSADYCDMIFLFAV